MNDATKTDRGELFAQAVKERNELRSKVTDLKKQMEHMEPANHTFQNYIEAPPMAKEQLWGNACANDAVTVSSWADQWMSQMAENAKKYDFHKDSVFSEAGKSAYAPVIIAGSGPSLKKNAHLLKDRDPRIKLVSCCHNFGYFEDLGVKADYYVNLDAGDITIGELSQGGKRDPEEYWELTKNHTLVSAIHTHPDMNNKWKGDIKWFRTPMPDAVLNNKTDEVTNNFKMSFSVGGNTLGACLYMARAVLGGCPIVFVGADFAFGRDKKFHPFDSPYDNKFAGLMPVTDVFGDRRYTWRSYFNFKNYFEHVAMGGSGNNPGFFVNCTEGGILGAFPEGNMMQIQQMGLEDFLARYGVHKHLTEENLNNNMLLY